MELIRIEDVSFSYPEQTSLALSHVNLTIEKGEFLVLFGHSGCGKSTLLRHLKPSLAPHGSLSGAIYYDNAPLNMQDCREMAGRIGFVLQSPESQVVTDKVWHELAFGLESLGEDTSTIRRRCGEMAAFFGIEPWYYKDVSELSGGQRQLLCLASVMTLRPELLILDEPTAQLDPIAASEFLDMLGKINRELGTTILLSEHRLEEALAMADRCAVMEHGSILCCGTADELGRELKTSGNIMFSALPCAMRLWGSVDTNLPCPVTVNEGRRFLHDYAAAHTLHKLNRKEPAGTAGEASLRAREILFRYNKDSHDVVRGLDFTAHSGELYCILGGNGAGKSTALKLLCGLETPQRGEITHKGNIAMLPQNSQTVFLKKTVYEDLKDVRKGMKLTEKQQDEEIMRIAALCCIENLLYRHPYDLSGGEQQRAALAKILLLAPDILLLDEPTKGFDMPFKKTFAEILRKLCNSGVSIVMVSHDVEFCASYADRCGLFFDGHIVTEGTPDSFFAGNSFYTTAAGRIFRETEPEVITTDDGIQVLCGQSAEAPVTSEKAYLPAAREQCSAPAPDRLPVWRIIGAAASGLGALGILLYTAKSGQLSNLVGKTGMTSAGRGQLAVYSVFIALLALTAFFIGRRSKTPAAVQTAPEKRRLSRRTAIAAVLILLCIPVTLFIGIFYIERKQYYITALAVLLECMTPFFLVFEGRKPKARELVVIAAVCAMSIAGRAAFFMLPQFKPVMAFTIIAGVAFGGETGFLVGAVTMLVSNILFSQGPWTPWQMFAMGIIGFIAGVLYRKGFLRRSRESLCIFGALCTFIIYGGIMNPASALIWGSETLNWNIILAYYITGFPMDTVHAAATVIFLWFGAEPMLEKLDRVKIKYGLMQ